MSLPSVGGGRCEDCAVFVLLPGWASLGFAAKEGAMRYSSYQWGGWVSVCARMALITKARRCGRTSRLPTLSRMGVAGE